MLVHFSPSVQSRPPKNFMLVEIDAPDDSAIEIITLEDIPKTASRTDKDGRTWH